MFVLEVVSLWLGDVFMLHEQPSDFETSGCIDMDIRTMNAHVHIDNKGAFSPRTPAVS